MDPLSTRRAAIDLGSNTAQLLVLRDDVVVADEAIITGLGRDLVDGGPLSPDGVEAAIDALQRFAAIAARHGVPLASVRAATTSAVRRAADGDAFLATVHASTGLTLRCISGQAEGNLTFLGATAGGPSGADDDELIVIDVGGGSTEVIAGTPGRPRVAASLEVGSVRLTERWLGPGPSGPLAMASMRSAVVAAVADLPALRHPARVLGVAGTVTTLGATAHGLLMGAALDGLSLSRTALAELVAHLAPLDSTARCDAVPYAPARAPYLVAGAILLDVLLEHLGHDALCVSERGLRWGLVTDALPDGLAWG